MVMSASCSSLSGEKQMLIPWFSTCRSIWGRSFWGYRCECKDVQGESSCHQFCIRRNRDSDKAVVPGWPWSSRPRASWRRDQGTDRGCTEARTWLQETGCGISLMYVHMKEVTDIKLLSLQPGDKRAYEIKEWFAWIEMQASRYCSLIPFSLCATVTGKFLRLQSYYSTWIRSSCTWRKKECAAIFRLHVLQRFLFLIGHWGDYAMWRRE